MLKYINTDIVFQEIPDEVTLAINISNCPCHCPGCHSKYLWADTGMELDEQAIDAFVQEFGKDITCISFMGGDAEPERVGELAHYIKNQFCLKTAWYSGRTIISSKIRKADFNYIKIGPFIQHLGPLNSKTTNQKMYKINEADESLIDITSRFWKK